MSDLLLLMEGVSLRPEARAIVAAMTARPSESRQAAINTLVGAMLDAGVWSKIGVLYVHAAHDVQASLLNWKDPAGTPASRVNSATFAADRGYQGDGVSMHVDYGVAQNAVPGAAQDANHWGIYAETSINNTSAAGTIGAGQTQYGRGAGGTVASRLNTAALTQVDAFPTGAGTHHVFSRGASGSYDRYQNGVAITAGVATSVALVAGNLVALRSNTTYCAAGFEIRAKHAGGILSAGEVSALRAALAAYMLAVGTT